MKMEIMGPNGTSEQITNLNHYFGAHDQVLGAPLQANLMVEHPVTVGVDEATAAISVDGQLISAAQAADMGINQMELLAGRQIIMAPTSVLTEDGGLGAHQEDQR